MRLEEKLGSDDVGAAGYPVPVGPYLLLHRLAKGGMGEVHLAKHGGLAGIEKYCVVKTLKRGAIEDEESVRRFMDEARIVVNLAHRNICSVFDVGRADERYYLAMEHVAGRDLREVVAQARKQGIAIPPAVAIHIVCEMLEALDYAHRMTHPSTGEPLHLVHRDVSPANIMVSVEGEVKLIDFGLALSRVKEQRTEPHMVMGKLAYMPPEQLACETLDQRADLFSAAVILYELLSNDRFYGDLNDGGIVHAAATGSYVPPKLQEIDAELQTILRAALHRDRAQRSADCAELRHQLGQYAMKQQMSSGSRELRALMEALFPDERERVRGLLARFGNVRGLPRAPEQESAARGSAGESVALFEAAAVVTLHPPASAAPPPVEHFDTFDSFDFETSDPSTPVGRVRLAKADPTQAKPGTPRPELLDRLGIISEPSPAAPALAPVDDDSGFDEPTQVISRSAEPPPPRRAALPIAAGVGLLASVALAFVLVRGGPEQNAEAALPSLPQPVARPALTHTQAPEPAAAVVESTGARAAEHEADEWIVAEPEPAADLGDEVANGAVADEAVANDALAKEASANDAVAKQAVAKEGVANDAVANDAVAKEPSAKQAESPAAPAHAATTAVTTERKAQRPRVVRKKLVAPGPKAKAEQKIRYLDLACRKKTPCAGDLVDRFRGMRVENARTFWGRVDSCISRCAP